MTTLARHQPRAVVILAAGKGTRMKSVIPKVLHTVACLPMIEHVIMTAQKVEAEKIVVVLAPKMERVQKHLAERYPELHFAIQMEPRGTGDAVKAALPDISGHQGPVAVLYGDTPLLTADTVRAMFEVLEDNPKHGLAVLGMSPLDPAQYGRLVLSDHTLVEAIVEYKDASEEQRDIPWCNAGVMAVRGDKLGEWLGQLVNANASGEYYLTDLVAIARTSGFTCPLVSAEEQEVMGVNSRSELAQAEYLMQQRLREAAMENGVTLIDPETVYFAYDTQIASDVVVEPHVWFGAGVRIDTMVQIHGFSHIEGAEIAAGASIGPYARLRPDTKIATEARIGNFVEIKKATIEHRAKVNHLSYIGDAHVGTGTNIGAGTITCNYDGFAKHHTHIGDGVFIGSNSALIAPVMIGDGAIVGAGSVITEDVDADALDIARSPQKSVKNWAKQYRLKKLS